MRRIAAAATVIAALGVPATADAGSYLNDSSSNGAYAITSGGTIDRFELFCAGKGHTDTSYSNNFAFSLRGVVELGHKGHFSYSGYAFRYGNEHQARGVHKVKVSGRLTSTAVRAKWTLPGCGSGTVTARRQ